MNWVDGLIVVALIVYVFEGLRRGFIEQTLELIGFFITIFLALWTYQPLASWLVGNVGLNDLNSGPIAFLIIWVVYQLIYSFVLHLTYPMVPVHWRLNKPNHFAGVFPALVKCVIIVSLIVTMTVLLDVPEQLKNEINRSTLGSKFITQTSRVESFLAKAFGSNYKQSLSFKTVPPQNEEIIQPNERVNLNFKTDEVEVDKSSEQEMLRLVNEERKKAGLSALVWDEKLAEVARLHSADMFAKGYFSHENMEGLSPFDRMAKANIKYQTAGENLAYAANVILAHNGLMRSPGHRANILEAKFGRIGIGVVDGGSYGKMFTQAFTD